MKEIIIASIAPLVAIIMADSKNINLLKKNKFKILTGQLEEAELEYIIEELETDFHNASKQWDAM